LIQQTAPKQTQTEITTILEKLSELESFDTEYFSFSSNLNDNGCSTNSNEISLEGNKLLEGLENQDRKKTGKQELKGKHLGNDHSMQIEHKIEYYENPLSEIINEYPKLKRTKTICFQSDSNQLCYIPESATDGYRPEPESMAPEYYKPESIIYTADEFTDLIGSLKANLKENESFVDQRLRSLGEYNERISNGFDGDILDFNLTRVDGKEISLENQVITTSNGLLMEKDGSDCTCEDSVEYISKGFVGDLEKLENMNTTKYIVKNNENHKIVLDFKPKPLTTSIDAYLDELRLLIASSFSSSSSFSDEFQFQLEKVAEKDNMSTVTESTIGASGKETRHAIPRKPVEYKATVTPLINDFSFRKSDPDDVWVKPPGNKAEQINFDGSSMKLLEDSSMAIKPVADDNLIKLAMDHRISDYDLDESIELAKHAFMAIISGNENFDGLDLTNDSIQFQSCFEDPSDHEHINAETEGDETNDCILFQSCFDNTKCQMESYMDINLTTEGNLSDDSIRYQSCFGDNKDFILNQYLAEKSIGSVADESEDNAAYISQKISFKTNLDNTNDSIHFVSCFAGNNHVNSMSDETSRDMLGDTNEDLILNESSDFMLDDTESSILFESCFMDSKGAPSEPTVVLEDSDILDETECSIVFESCFAESLDDSRDTVDETESSIHFESCFEDISFSQGYNSEYQMGHIVSVDKVLPRYSLGLDRLNESDRPHPDETNLVDNTIDSNQITPILSKLSISKSIETLSSSNSTSFNEPTEYHDANSTDSDQTIKYQLPPLSFQTPPKSKRPVIRTLSRNTSKTEKVSSLDSKKGNGRGSEDSIQTTPYRFRVDLDKTPVRNGNKRSVDPKHPLPPLPKKNNGENLKTILSVKGKKWFKKVFSLS
jgi:hypothetical protein